MSQIQMLDWELETQQQQNAIPSDVSSPVMESGWWIPFGLGSLLGLLMLLTFALALTAFILALTRKNNGSGQIGPQGTMGPIGPQGPDGCCC